MNKAQQQAQLGLLKSEDECIAALEKAYNRALADIKAQIKQYSGDDLTQSQIYQKQYQEALKGQVEAILDNMQASHYGTIQGYLKGCYEDSYIGVMYDLKSQGIPVTAPIQQDQVVKAVTTDSKLSAPMYDAMGKYLKPLKKNVAAELSRGFASGMHYNDIARNIEAKTHIGLYNATRIARTEGHRIQCAAALDAQKAAKEAGADVVKQWDSTMDKRTRPHHRMLDGQIREIDEPFEINGREAMAPGQFGVASEDIHCRCAILQRAKWALDEDELKALEEKAQFWGIDKQESLTKFKEDYIDGAGKQAKLAELSKKLADGQAELGAMNKTYSGIWKDDVSLADYVSKKDSIPAKKAYYKDMLDAMDSQGLQHVGNYDKFQGFLDDLDEFERLGAQYADKSKELQRIRAEIQALLPPPDPTDMFSQRRKDAALWFDKDHGGFREADRYLDPHAHEIHNAATKSERRGFYTYTEGSGGHNRPLAGFQKPYYDSSHGYSGWEPGYYKGAKNVWIDYEGKGDEIRGLTTLIEKSTYNDDIWLQSGQGFGTVEGFLGIKTGALEHMGDAELQQYVGRSNRIYNFISTAVNEGGGAMFNEKPVKINFYAPSGTQMLYASDVGAYGKGENEMILQRGGYYRITRIYWGTDATDGNKRKLFVDMEIHPERGYDTFQQDPNEWTGSKEDYQGVRH